MGQRILRDWTDSEDVNTLTSNEERFFTRLIMKADDYGRYTANVRMLKSTLFPLKTDIRETDISLWLAACEKCGLISLYNVVQKDFLQINKFQQRLRQKKEIYPPPNKHVSNRPPEEKRREVESEKEEEVEIEEFSPVKKTDQKSLTETFYQDFTNSQELEIVSMHLNVPKNDLITALPDFRKVMEIEYQSLNKFATHFKNWFKKRQISNQKEQNQQTEFRPYSKRLG